MVERVRGGVLCCRAVSREPRLQPCPLYSPPMDQVVLLDEDLAQPALPARVVLEVELP